MKKFGIHHKLYQNEIFNYTDKFIEDLIDIDKIKFFKDRDTEYKLDVLNCKLLEEPKAILILFLFFNETTLAFKVGSFIIKNQEIFLNQKANYFNKISKKVGKNKIIQVFAIDPEKLIQVGDMDTAFQEHNRKVIKRDKGIKEDITEEFIGFVNSKKRQLNEIGQLKEFNIDKHDSIEDFLNFLEIDKIKHIDNYEVFKKLALMFRDRTYKLKVFEPHVYFKIRLGYEGGHFVLFLHPYESESNNPIRIPSE